MTKDEQIENLRETIEHMGRRLQAKDGEIEQLRSALDDELKKHNPLVAQCETCGKIIMAGSQNGNNR